MQLGSYTAGHRRLPALISLLLLVTASNICHCIAQVPHLVRSQHRVDLIVDGKPWLIFGGELRNSSSSTLDFLRPIWPQIESLHLNTLFVPVSWKQFEPAPGHFDYSLLDGIIGQAREHHCRLVLLWMGSWKNGVSGYAPGWVMTHPERYLRMSPTTLSPFGLANMKADATAFATMMAHLRQIDEKQHTVIMIQIENEVGVSSPARDYSLVAQIAFQGPVPDVLLRAIAQHEGELQPYVRDPWQRHGRKMRGSWSEVFGSGSVTNNIFMAWYFGRYINYVASAGKTVYPLPMYVNASQWSGMNFQEGLDQCGGPAFELMDIWMTAAPSIDIYAVDNYHGFKFQAAAYRHRDNPLFMPECCLWYHDDPYSSPAKAFYAFGEQGALSFSPFGIDNQMYRSHLLGLAYQVLRKLQPLIIQYRGTNRMHGFFQDPGETEQTFSFDGYSALVAYRKDPRASPVDDQYGSFGLIIQSGKDEFYVAGRGFTVRFQSANPELPITINLDVEEGDVDNLKGWHTVRHLNGDEVGGQGTDAVLMLPPYSRQPVIGEREITLLKLLTARLKTIDSTSDPSHSSQ